MSWLKIIGKLNSKKVGIGLVRWGNLHTLAYGGIRKVSRKGLALLTAILLVLQMIYLPFPFESPKKAYATSGQWSQTTFTGSDGTYTSTQPANSNQDTTLDNFSALSNAGGGKWQYRKPVTVDNTSNSNTLTDYQVLLDSEANVVGDWHLDENTGTTVTDSSRNNNNGTMNGTSYWTASGKYGAAFNASGDDYVSAADNSSLNIGTNNFTIEGWFRNIGGSAYYPMVAKGSTTTDRYYLFIDSDAGATQNKVTFLVNSGGVQKMYFISDAAIGQDGLWHHIAVTLTRNSVAKMYIDGQVQTSQPNISAYSSENWVSTGNLEFGRAPFATTRYFAGNIDEVKIYNRALSASEVQARYNDGGFFQKVKADGSDVRFTDSNGTSELDYWVESWSNSSTTKNYKIWTKVPSIPASSTKTIYEYYGNPSATFGGSYANNGANTFEFFDDFDTYSLGDLNGQGGWSGNIAFDVVNDQVKTGSKAIRVDQEVAIEKTFNALTTGLVFQGYMWGNPTGRRAVFGINEGATNRLQIYFGVANNIYYISSAGLTDTVADYTSNYWHKVEQRVSGPGGTIKVFVDGNEVVSAGTAPSYTNVDRVRLWMGVDIATEYARWDQLIVRKYVSPEPSAGTPGAETTVYVSSGTLVSQTINPTGFYDWGTLVFTKTTPSGTTLTVDVLRASDSMVLATNVASGTDLNTAGVSNSETSIKLRANFSTTDTSVTPTLSDWTVNYDYDTTLPTDPSGLSATAASATQINLSWTASTDSGGSGLAGYKIERAPDVSGSPGTFSQIGTSATTSYSDSTVSANTKYWYRVRAYDNAGNNSGYTTANTPAWFNASWQYRKPIAITGSTAGAQTNYQVLVTVDTAALISAGKMQNTGADIRFTNASGIELPYWIESGINTTATKIWVKVDSIPASPSTATIYEYYGNPSATSASSYTNTFPVLGTGADGDINLSPGSATTYNLNTTTNWPGSPANAPGVNFSVTENRAANTNQIVIDSSTAAGLSANDEILIINLRGTSTDNTNVGKYETVRIQSIATNTPSGKSTLTLSSYLKNAYNGTTQKIMVQRVPNWGIVTIGSNATITANVWDGTKGGVVIFRASGNLIINGKISADSIGFNGGASVYALPNWSGATYSYQGDGHRANGAQTTVANGGAGGGGLSANQNATGGGGGAGYSSAGTAGGGGNCGASGGEAGAVTGDSSISQIYMGFGGGAGNGSDVALGGAGGRGGGIIKISANSITNGGNGISANASAGGNAAGGGGGGGGAGGSVYLLGDTVSLGTNIVTVNAGSGGAAGPVGGGCTAGAGGAGSVGRIKVDYYSSISGSTNPSNYNATGNPTQDRKYASPEPTTSAGTEDSLTYLSSGTLIESPSGLTFSNVTATSIDVTALGTFTNLTTPNSGIYFDESVTVTNSGWQTIPTWSKSGLSPNTQYSFRAKTRNQDSTENSFTTAYTKYTLANTPGTPTVATSWNSTNGYYADITVNTNGNTAGTNYAVTTDAGTNWVQTDGSLSPTVYWQTSTTFTHKNLSANTTYSYQVKAKNGESMETALNATAGSDTTPPAQVTGLLHTGNATTTIAWDWADIMGATSYKVFAGTHSDLETTQVSGCGDVTASNCTQTGLSANTQYTVHIHAANANGTGANSATSSAYISIEAPTGITFGTVGLNSIGVSASGTFSNLTAGLSGILLTNTTQGTNSGWTQVNSWTSSSLTANTQYGFKAQARNAEGDLTEETSVSNKYTLAVTPNASADKSTSTWYNTSTFTFTNNASFGGGGVQYYRYQWDQSATHTWSDTETQWSSGTLARTATSNGSWYLHLKSFNGDNVSNLTTLDLGPYYFDGSTPSITDNQAGDNTYRNSSGTTYDVDFSDAGGSNLNNIQYQVYSGASQTGTLLKDWTNIVTSINASSYTTDFGIDFSSLQEGTNYVTLRAYDNAGSSQTLVDAFYVKKDTVSPSSSSVVVNDGTGSDLTWVTSLTTLSSNWSGFSDSNSGLSSYEYSIGTTSGGTNTLGWTSNGSSTNFTNSSLVLTEGSTYYVSVRAKDQANNTSSVKSSNGVTVDSLAPTSSLSVSPSSPDGSNGWYKTLPTLSLSSSDLSSGVAQTYYQWELTTGVWTNYSSSFPGLEGEHLLYYYSLDNASNLESYKSSSLKVDTFSPGAPSSLAAQSVSQSQINLSWEESTDPTSGIDQYKVYRSLDNQNFTEIASSSSSSYSDTGLKASTTYFYKVSSVDKASNESSSSNTASATTKSPPSKSPSPTNPPSDEEEETGTSPAPTKAKPEETLKVKEVVIKVGEKNLSLTPNEKNEVKVLEGIVKKVTIKVPIADALSATAVINGKEYVLTKEGDYFVGEVKVPSSAGSYEVVITYVTSKGEEKQAKSITLLVDPFGFVYDKDTKARIGNAKVGLFKYDSKTQAYSLWEAKRYGQENPQETNSNGRYGFMVPKGKYYLLVEAPLYESYKSKVLEVEAEPLTLNIGLELEKGVIPQEKAQSLPPYLILIFVFGLALAIGGATYLFRRPKSS